MTSDPSDTSTSTYEQEVLAALMDEWSEEQRARCERNAKRRLREKNLGPFDIERVEMLRALKKETRAEIDKHRLSPFYNGGSGRLAHSDDWDSDGLCHHLLARYPKVPAATMRWFVSWAIYHDYLR